MRGQSTDRIHVDPILAANANTIAQANAIIDAAVEEESGVIIQVSQTVLQEPGGRDIVEFVQMRKAEHSLLPISLNLDHGLSYEVCAEAIELGFDSVMIDGTYKPDGVTPRNFLDNREVTKRVVEFAHSKGVEVEGALGLVGSLTSCLGYLEEDYTPIGPFERDAFLTDVDMAISFVEDTKVDALAIAIGSTHGPSKFEREPGVADLELDRIDALRRALPETKLVLHGSSSVPQYIQDMFREFGGEMEPSWGMPLPILQDAVRRGVGKINIDTDLRIAMVAGMRKFLAESPSVANPRLIEAAGAEQVQLLCKEKIRAFARP